MRIDHVKQLEVIDQRTHDREHHNGETHGRGHNMRAYTATGDDITVVIAETDEGFIKVYLSDSKD